MQSSSAAEEGGGVDESVTGTWYFGNYDWLMPWVNSLRTSKLKAPLHLQVCSCKSGLPRGRCDCITAVGGRRGLACTT